MSQNGLDNTDSVYPHFDQQLIRLCLVTGALSCLQLRFNVLLQEFNVIYRVMTLGKCTFTSDQLVRGLEQIIRIPEWEIKSDKE